MDSGSLSKRLFKRSLADRVRQFGTVIFPLITLSALVYYLVTAQILHADYTSAYWALIAMVWSIPLTFQLLRYRFGPARLKRYHKLTPSVFSINGKSRSDSDAAATVASSSSSDGGSTERLLSNDNVYYNYADEHDEVDDVISNNNNNNNNGVDIQEDSSDRERFPLLRNSAALSSTHSVDDMFLLVEEKLFMTRMSVWGIIGCVIGILACLFASICMIYTLNYMAAAWSILTVVIALCHIYFIAAHSMTRNQMSKRKQISAIRMVRKVVIIITVVLLLLMQILACLQSFVTAYNKEKFPPIGTMYRVGTGGKYYTGDRMLHMFCNGTGSPTVFHIHGIGGQGLDWAWVQPEVSKYTKSCLYDRAGYGWSDEPPCADCRDSHFHANDLYELIQVSGMHNDSFVFVVSNYAVFELSILHANHAELDIKAIVCVDCEYAMDTRHGTNIKNSPPAFWNGIRNLLPSGICGVLAASGKVEQLQAYAPLPESVRLPYIQNNVKPQYAMSVVEEFEVLPQSAQQAVDAGGFGWIPLYVITAGRGYNQSRIAELSNVSSLYPMINAPYDLEMHLTFAQNIEFIIINMSLSLVPL